MEPATHGHETIGATPTKGRATSAITPLATVINAFAVKGSSLILSSVFQLAWHNAAKRTAAKTKESIKPFSARRKSASGEPDRMLSFSRAQSSGAGTIIPG